MRKMRAIGGYMTVEVSVVLPIVLMVLWLFFGYLFYFMDCAIANGIVEEAGQKAADIRITGADYDTGKLSYGKLNQKLVQRMILSSNKNGNVKAEKEIKEQCKRHLFMAGISYIKVSTTPLKVTVDLRTNSNIAASQFLSMFHIRWFEHEERYQALGDFEMEQIRGWNAIERTVD